MIIPRIPSIRPLLIVNLSLSLQSVELGDPLSLIVVHHHASFGVDILKKLVLDEHLFL